MNILKKISKHFLAVREAKNPIGGLEISDYALRSAVWGGSAWRLAAVRLLPGTMVHGVIKNKPRLLSSLGELRTALVGKSKKRIAAIFSLSSVHIDSKMFSVPLAGGGDFEKAVQLNIEMNAPVKIDEFYAGWEVLGKDDAAHRADILSAFAPRQLVDNLSKVCAEAGFVVAVVEPKALALSRLVSRGDSGFNPDKPAIIIASDASGFNFSIIRSGQLYFEYLNQWQDIEDEKGNVSLADFSKAVLRGVREVVNFYRQHWPEEIHDIYIISSAFREEIARVIKDSFPAFISHIVEFRGMPSLDPQWFVAVGSGIRGKVPRRADRYLNLMESEHL